MSNKKQTSPTTVGKTEVFNFSQEKAPIRVQLINGEPWFVAADVCQVLDIKNSRDTLAKVLDEDEKGVATIYTLGGRQKIQVVTESGLYHLIFQSRKPDARKFRKWVTSEVLPSIRKSGGYSVPATRPGRERALIPCKRSKELKQFYAELLRYTTRSDEELVAGILHVTRKHVHDVAAGRTMSYGVCCMLVDCALDNRKKGIRRLERNRQADMEDLCRQLILPLANSGCTQLSEQAPSRSFARNFDFDKKEED